MNKIYKYSLYALAAIGLGFVVYDVTRRFKKNKGVNTEGAETQGVINGGNSNSSVFPLKLGSTGEEVKWMQNLLNEYFDSGLQVNGNFDEATDAALRSAQTSAKARLALRLKGTPEGWKIGEVSYGTYTMINNALA